MRRVLVANRGEIAVRIIRACRELGLATAAVYSEADRDALHVRLADERLLLGPAELRESYLSADRLLEAARRCGADAVHPGYGFLSESPAFAAAVRDAGLTFIGPPPEVIARLGDKIQARRLAAEAGVPGVPGFGEPGATDDLLAETARRLGFPVMIKAAGGGGGRGMRLVDREEDLPGALAAARREAEAAFGSDALLLERVLSESRHIEIQVLVDQQGTILVLGERECSVQRRYQKIIEEAPSPFVSPALRVQMCEAAAAIARAAGYVNAGTVEFLVDPDGAFYFLEVNTRLQVEHPVTEATTGIDLVKAQLRIAAGEPLNPEPVEPVGHAIECRIYAEDPSHDFSPSPGLIAVLNEPQGPGLRVDSGLRPGWRVPVAYDPLLAKVIAWDHTRADAIARMDEALARYVILGCRTNLAFLRSVITHEAFRRAETTAGFLSRYFSDWRPAVPDLALAAAAVVEVLGGERALGMASGPPGYARQDTHRGSEVGPADGARVTDPWDRIGPWRMGVPRA